MVVPIGEIVDVVTSHSIYSVINSSLVSSFACASEIRLQSWSAGVKVTHYICIISPTLSENGLESLRELLERGNVPVGWEIYQVHFV